MSRFVFLFALLIAARCFAAPHPVYVVLWFDTEDFIDPRSDDAAMEIAERLRALGVRATFKVVGEKARFLEKNGRHDVIEALRFHDIGSHGTYHSLHPTPSEYLETMDLNEGAAQFYAHEISGVRDVARVFGQYPSCYGQPGASFGPHKYLALPKLGIPIYFDSISHLDLDAQPFWYEGILNELAGKPYLVRPSLDSPPGIAEGRKEFDDVYAKLQAQGGGLVSVVYHPTEFVNAEFWDAANFSRGASPRRNEWRLPKPHSEARIKRAYEVLEEFVEYGKTKPGVQFITVAEFGRIYTDLAPSRKLSTEQVKKLADSFQTRIDFARMGDYSLSAAEITGAMVNWTLADDAARGQGITIRTALAPQSQGKSSPRNVHLTRDEWLDACRWADEFIRENRRLPATVWYGIHSLSIEDFAATLAGDIAAGYPDAPQVPVRQANCGFCERVALDDEQVFDWVIHPEGFRGPNILKLTRLLAWSLKPAVAPGVGGR
jgi:hypothetical protein